MVRVFLWGIILGLVAVIVVNTSIFYAINVQANYQIVTKTIEESGANYSIKASYPQIYYLKSAQDKFNNFILSGIQSQIDEFKKTVSQPLNPAISKSIKNYLIISYSFVGNNPSYISALFNKEEFYAGSAHPGHTLSSINYDFKLGRNVELSELFKADSNYLDVISNYAYRLFLHQISSGQLESNEDYLNQGNGVAPNIKNFVTFGITNQALILNFQEYQVGPYVAGQPRIVVPYLVLKDAINPDGLLEQFIKNISQTNQASAGNIEIESLKTLSNNEYNFEIKYPENLVPENSFRLYYILSDKWRSGYYSEITGGKPIVSIPVYRIENQSSYPRYYGVEVRIGASSAPQDIKDCYNNYQTGFDRSSENVSINGIGFKKFDISGAAMMQYLKGSSYRTIHNGMCFAVEQLAAGSNYRDQVSPNDISEGVLDSYFNKAGDIVKTFRFTK